MGYGRACMLWTTVSVYVIWNPNFFNPDSKIATYIWISNYPYPDIEFKFEFEIFI